MAATIHARILCIGNRFFAPDTAGPLVFDLLNTLPLPVDVELVDGGLGGLNLLPYLEKTELVVFVDAVVGFRKTPGIVVINPLESPPSDSRYDHDAGLAYLLQTAPHVLEGGLPELILVGIEGSPSPDHCRQAGNICLTLVTTAQHPNLCALPAGQGGDCDG
ncbi:MAG: hydrogenase maturation protease [Desulfoprunum sp.]|nr:hydrogenase maturation protease [Desulfoprunum sp.]